MLATLIAENNPCLTIPPEIPNRDEQDLHLALAIVKAMLEYMPRREVRNFLEALGA